MLQNIGIAFKHNPGGRSHNQRSHGKLRNTNRAGLNRVANWVRNIVSGGDNVDTSPHASLRETLRDTVTELDWGATGEHEFDDPRNAKIIDVLSNLPIERLESELSTLRDPNSAVMRERTLLDKIYLVQERRAELLNAVIEARRNGIIKSVSTKSRTKNAKDKRPRKRRARRYTNYEQAYEEAQEGIEPPKGMTNFEQEYELARQIGDAAFGKPGTLGQRKKRMRNAIANHVVRAGATTRSAQDIKDFFKRAAESGKGE